jgi:nucleoside-diphosphate-sugar epimerase
MSGTDPATRILVTGATGFLGRHLTDEMSRRGWSYAVMARSRVKAAGFEAREVEVVHGDLTEAGDCHRACRGRDLVVHLAAAADVSDHALNRRVNLDGLLHLIEACRANGVARILFVSSTCAGRKIRDAYGETKRQGEDLVRDSGLFFTILRPTMIYGRGSKEFDLFVRAVRWSPVLPLVAGGRHLVQPVYLGDAVAAILAVAGCTRSAGKTYDLAGPTPVSIAELAQRVARVLGRRRRIVLPVPLGLALAAARGLGSLMSHVPVTVDQVMAFAQDTSVDLGPLREDIGFAPRALAEGLQLALAGRPSC